MCFGIGIANLLPDGYNEYYPDEILNLLVNEVEPYLSAAAEIREVLFEPGIELYTREEPTDKPTVIGSGIGWGGGVGDDIAQPILAAIKNIDTLNWIPYSYSREMPEPLANILIHGFGEPIVPPRPIFSVDRMKLNNFCVTRLRKYDVGGLEQHIASFTQWRDLLLNDPEFKPDESTGLTVEEVVEFYDKSLLPMLHFCNEHRLIFVFYW